MYPNDMLAPHISFTDDGSIPKFVPVIRPSSCICHYCGVDLSDFSSICARQDPVTLEMKVLCQECFDNPVRVDVQAKGTSNFEYPSI